MSFEYIYEMRCVFLPCDVRQVVVFYDGTASITYEHRMRIAGWSDSGWTDWVPLVPDEVPDHRRFLMSLKQR